LKKILKKVFHAVALKKVWLWYNVVRISTVDRILYGKAKVGRKDFDVYSAKNPFLELNIPTSHLPADIVRGLALWMDPLWTQDEYILKYSHPGFIDPETGWAITAHADLIYPSLGFSSAPYVRKPSWWAMRFRRSPIVELDKVISLRDTGEENYFHFYNDVMAKIFYLRDHGLVLEDYAVVVSARLWQKPFFTWYVQNSRLRELRFVVQDQQWLSFKSAVFCKPYTHTKKYFDEMVSIAAVGHSRERRLFLTRRPSTLRYISNEEQVVSILREFGFEVVDPGELSPGEQFDLFAGATHVVAVHGASITNVIFRGGKPLSLLELVHPHNYVPFHYIMLAALYGYSYQAILGKSSGHGGFKVDIGDLRNQVRKLIES
jgi:hypothetical protein